MVMVKTYLGRHIEFPSRSRQVGVAAVKNSRRPGLLNRQGWHRRSVLDAPLNPNWFHSGGLR